MRSYDEFILQNVKATGGHAHEYLANEIARQNECVELIASENYPSDAVLAACGSVMGNKYTEGYPGKRYYGGCENFDKMEKYGEVLFQELFKTDYHFNLQPHSGSSANCIAYSALMEHGDKMMALGLQSGGHLTHSGNASFVTKSYRVYEYGTDENGLIDYVDMCIKAQQVKPKVIVCGASSYPRQIDFKAIRKICDACEAYMVADIAHTAGLVAAGIQNSPFGLADVVTFTTQKTFRGPHGGVIACKKELARQIDQSCFPRWQGGPLQNQILGKIIAAEEACSPEFEKYARQTVKNASSMAERFSQLGYDIVTGGTDNHLFVINFSNTHPELTGKEVQDLLDEHGITVNKNCVPNENRSPRETSGIRIGLAAMTTKGWDEKKSEVCATAIHEIIKNYCEEKENGRKRRKEDVE